MNEKNGNSIIDYKGNLGLPTHGITDNGGSAEDLSEYTDADESMSAPTECLAEFLSALMLKDYPSALKHCKIILQYEPKNATAVEFYPLIMKKIDMSKVDNSESSESDDNSNQMDSDNDNDNGETLSDNSEDSEESDEGDYSSDGPCNSPGHDYQGNSAGSASCNTTHSCSSLEDEEAEYLTKTAQRCLDLGNGNHEMNLTSDSESPTEPLSQQTVAFLRAKALGSCSNKT